MTTATEGAKQKLRQAATRGCIERPRLSLEESKAKLRSAAAGLDLIGDELTRHLGTAELKTWVKRDPWQAILCATVGGFVAAHIKDSGLLLFSVLSRLVDLTAAD